MRERSLIRYMGTKRMLAETVRGELITARSTGTVVDLFSGMGAVARAVSPTTPVWLNDALAFPGVFARAQFTDVEHPDADALVLRLHRPYLRALRFLGQQFEAELRAETNALRSRAAMLRYLNEAGHVGNTGTMAKSAAAACTASGLDHYRLAALYFGAGYFSRRQAIQIDALRYAIDLQERSLRNWLLAGWLSAAAAVLNAPGHTAQYLRPNTDSGYDRIARRWNRDVWEEFSSRIALVTTLGHRTWRAKNRVTTDDALAVLRTLPKDRMRAIYADPPYTKDHYSRYYHVYETLYLYDYPSSEGAGRYRADRFRSEFSIKSRVVETFESLFGLVRQLAVPFVLSYPTNGLLYTRVDLEEVLRQYLHVQRVHEIATEHSALGGHGKTTKAVTERIYVCSAAS